MARKFSELRAEMSEERQQRNAEAALALLAAMDLNELRAARDITQEDLAARLNVAQSNVSRMEHRADVLVSTLRQVIEAMGGELHIIANFTDGAVRIRQFEEATV